jgi:hypothetical protein
MERDKWHPIGHKFDRCMTYVRYLGSQCFWSKRDPYDGIMLYLGQLKNTIKEIEDDIRTLRSGDGQSGEADSA